MFQPSQKDPAKTSSVEKKIGGAILINKKVLAHSKR